MILIADSGSTKTDWCIVFNDTPIKRIGTKGINSNQKKRFNKS